MKIKSKMMLFYAAILFGFHLTLSSCANNKDKGKTNPVVDRADASKSTHMHYELSEVGKYLYSKGCAEYEISEMMKIEKEDFEGPIEHVIYHNYHFHYKHHDKGQTYANCGLYAVKRLLFALGKKGIVAKDLWYKYTDVELRDMIVKISGDESDRNQGKVLDVWDVDRLMFRFLDVKPPYNGVWCFHDKSYHCMYGVTEKTVRLGHDYYNPSNCERYVFLPDGTLFLKYDGCGKLIFRLPTDHALR
jgi:hypothetical protein